MSEDIFAIDFKKAEEFCGHKAEYALEMYKKELKKKGKKVSKATEKLFFRAYITGYIESRDEFFSFIDEDFTSQGFKMDQFTQEEHLEMLDEFVNAYKEKMKTLKKDMRREILLLFALRAKKKRYSKED